MSTSRIDLTVVELEGSPALRALRPDATVTRVVAEVLFERTDSTLAAKLAIVDTGAPLCVIPCNVWQGCPVEVLGPYPLRGLVRKRECIAPASLGRIRLHLADRGRPVDSLDVLACLAHAEEVPLLLGFRDVLEHYVLRVDPCGRAASLTGKGAERP